jgi:hypothetical protein
MSLSEKQAGFEESLRKIGRGIVVTPAGKHDVLLYSFGGFL